MSDNSGSSKPSASSIPSWQLPASDSQSTTGQPPSNTTADEKPSTDAQETGEKQMTVAEKAVKWLEDPSIQNASRERKVAFLLSKGVARDDIDRLLPKKTAQQVQPAQDELKEIHASAGAEKTAPTPEAAQPQTSVKDVPPVITYPEFLLQPQDKPPLVTTQRLVNTAYVAGGLIATIYGLSKYVIAPMADSLTIARHEFLEHTASQVDDLNSRLEKNVSKLPSSTATHIHERDSADAEPPSPTDSDPTELYHRDMGTQTTPELSRRASTGGETSSSDEEATDAASLHESRLKSISKHAADLRTSSDTHTDGSLSDLQATVSELTQYLGDMSYNSPYYGLGYGGIDGRSVGTGSYTGAGGTGTGADADAKDKVDAVDALKAEIRSVKGVLLSARNFPAGRPMAAAGR